jgi:hypothetical protein
MSFLFRNKKEELRHGVDCEKKWLEEGKKFYSHFKAVCNLLESWVGGRTFRMGFKPINAILQNQENDYGRVISIGTFVNANKYNDIRGYLLSVVEVADEVRRENEKLKVQATRLETELTEFRYEKIKSEFRKGFIDYCEAFDRYCALQNPTPRMKGWAKSKFPEAYKKEFPYEFDDE